MVMDIEKALRKAYSLGQRYWQQADSEYVSQNKKASATEAEFDALISSAMAELSAPVPAMPMQDDRIAKEWQEIWNPIDELVRPLTPLGHSVAVKAVELIKQARAMPIPKQEPAGPVPDDSCTECGGRGEFVAMVNYEMDSNPCYKCGGTGKKINEIAYDINNKISIKCPECGTRTSTGVDVALKIIDLVGVHPSPRITEQDAREIINAYIDNKIGIPVNEWLTPLLNKLNIINNTED
jgi:hypothetical protein